MMCGLCRQAVQRFETLAGRSAMVSLFSFLMLFSLSRH